MDKKKLKLSISGNTKKTITNIEQAKSNPKNSVIINNNKTFQKKKFYKPGSSADTYKKPNSNLQSLARQKRYELLFNECKKSNIKTILTAHHQDD